MSSKRLYFIMLGIVGALALGLVGGAYGASTILQSQAKALIEARSKSMALEQQQAQLTKAKASIAKYEEIGKIAKSIVPQDKDQAQTIREIVNIASQHGVSLGAITFPTSTLGAAGGAKTGGNLSQLKVAPGITGVYTLQITVQSAANSATTYDQFVNFLAALERNRRTALVSAIALQPDAKNPNNVSFTLTIDEYIKP
jgi:F0F1-type ATP synthase delta subunit